MIIVEDLKNVYAIKCESMTGVVYIRELHDKDVHACYGFSWCLEEFGWHLTKDHRQVCLFIMHKGITEKIEKLCGKESLVKSFADGILHFQKLRESK